VSPTGADTGAGPAGQGVAFSARLGFAELGPDVRASLDRAVAYRWQQRRAVPRPHPIPSGGQVDLVRR